MNNTKRKKLSGRVTFFLFTLIPVVLYTFFYVVSVINGIRYSFTDWDGMAQKMNFIGWKNYKILLKKSELLECYKNNGDLQCIAGDWCNCNITDFVNFTEFTEKV